MTSENEVIAGAERRPRYGICRAASCPVAEEGTEVELYPGPGEYCPMCGELLDPVAAAIPAVAVAASPAVETPATPPAPAPPPPAPVAAAPVAAATVAAAPVAAVPPPSPPAARDVATSATAAPAAAAPVAPAPPPPPAASTHAERGPSRPAWPVPKRVAIAIGLVALAAAGGVAAVHSMTASPPDAPMVLRARPASAPLLTTPANEDTGDGSAMVARSSAVAASRSKASTLHATLRPIPAARPTPPAQLSAQPTDLPSPLPTQTPPAAQQSPAPKQKAPPKQVAALHRNARRPHPARTVPSSKIGADATSESPQPQTTQAAADSIPATSLAVEPTVPSRPTATPLSCARPDLPPAIVSAAVPDTPAMAEQQGISGIVHVIVSLNAQSRVVATRVQSSPSVLLNRAALAAARNSQFRTQIVGCVPVGADYVLDVNFTR